MIPTVSSNRKSIRKNVAPQFVLPSRPAACRRRLAVHWPAGEFALRKCYRTATLPAVVAFCRQRYDACRSRQPRLAAARLVIINRARDLGSGSPNAEQLLLDFISQHHDGPDLTKACKEVLKQLGGMV
jgi:hypothetical protein